MQAAKEWGAPPWEIAGDEDTLLWMYRWKIYSQVASDAERERARIRS